MAISDVVDLQSTLDGKVKTKFTSTTAVPVTNTTATLIGAGVGNVTVYANSAVHKVYKILVRCAITVGGTPSATVVLKLGSTTLATGSLGGTPSTGNIHFTFYVGIRITGGSGEVVYTGEYTNGAGAGANLFTGLLTAAAVSVDLSADHNFDVIATVSPGTTIQSNTIIIEEMN